LAFPQTQSQSDAELQVIVTVAEHVTHQPASLKADDVQIIGATITDWRRIEEGRELELFLLIDDAANYDFGSKLEELRQFVNSQPAPVPIGLAYIHDGALRIAEYPTTDHVRVAHALRAPSGSAAGNPYCALSDLIGQWQKRSLRREIILVSTGIDDSSTEGAVCVNAETTIHDAERAGVQIYALYNPVANYRSEKSLKVNSGVTQLGHVCYETGGEAYFRGNDPMESIGPYLADIAEHLAHQYAVKFRLSRPKQGSFQSIYAHAGSFDTELMVPESVWVPAAARK
jgi:hypothetical protein